MESCGKGLGSSLAGERGQETTGTREVREVIEERRGEDVRVDIIVHLDTLQNSLTRGFLLQWQCGGLGAGVGGGGGLHHPAFNERVEEDASSATTTAHEDPGHLCG